ncbi:MAG: septum site-determining protein MinD [Clostridia bacterium]|nr:septum site-determining protein MinD [Clostridia bacterium]
MGEVILVASGKGGTGKTVFTANMGAVLAQKGFRVVMIDMDMGLRNLDIAMGLENKVIYDVSDVMTGMCRIKQALIRDKRFSGLYLMSSPQHRDDGEITPLHMQVLCNKLRQRFDYIIIDAPSGIDDGTMLAAAAADKAVIVTVPEYTAIRDADILDRMLLQMDKTRRCYVLNKVKAELISSGFVPGLCEITQMLRPELAGIIQYDDNIHIAANNGVPIVLKRDSYISQNFMNIAERVIRL